MKNIVIILAAGESKRMQGIDKIQIEFLGKPVWKHSFDIFQKNKNCGKIFVVTRKNFKSSKKINIIRGGKTRFDSAKIAFRKILHTEKLKDSDIVIFHNAANPFLTSREVDQVIQKAKKHGACIAGTPANNTIKITKGQKITATLPRENILLAQTPQAFQVGILKKAYQKAYQQKKETKKITDESMLLENLNIEPFWIKTSPQNKKITTPEDLNYFYYLFGKSQTGIGTDSHKFDTKGTLKLCGISIKKFPKLKANSDGDIAIHALATAISQALGQGSLGTFADAINKKGMTESTEFLKPLFAKLSKKNLTIGHIGLHFECKNPRIDPLVPDMKKSLCGIFKIKSEQIGITATSGEELSPFGKGKGIHCIATANLWKK